MLAEWNKLSDALQLTLSQEAMRRAAETIAGQAELLAEEIECGALPDRGGPDALRLLAMVVRAAEPDPFAAAGHA